MMEIERLRAALTLAIQVIDHYEDTIIDGNDRWPNATRTIQEKAGWLRCCPTCRHWFHPVRRQLYCAKPCVDKANREGIVLSKGRMP